MTRPTSPSRAPNPRGRPRKIVSAPDAQAGGLSREAILQHALELTREEPLQAISIVRLAASLNVRAGTIHHHLGSRDALLTGVLNRFYRGLVEKLAEADDAAMKADVRITRISRVWLDHKVIYPGVVQYIIAEDRYRVFQDTAEDELDYGAVFMDRVFLAFRDCGFGPQLAAELWHLLALLTNATAETIAKRHAPASHRAFLLERAARFDAQDYPGLTHALPALAHLDAQEAFDRQVRDILHSFQLRRRRQTSR